MSDTIRLFYKLKSARADGKMVDYSAVDGAPIIEADLTTATLTANTYYKHTGATGTYTTGVIYYYNGSSLKPIDGDEYTLPVATSSALGGIKTGYTASGANLPVALSNEKAYVALTKTAVTSALGYTPPESNTDTKVTQTKTTSASSMPLLLAPAGQTATTTTTANFTNNIYAVPSTGRLYVTGSSNPLFGIQATNGTAFFLQAQTDKLFLGPTSAKALTFTGSTGAVSMPNNLTVTGTISEGGTTLANKYLGKTAKAASATVADSANAVAWGNVSGKPTFATVATSGSYNDLTNKPTIPSAYTLPVATSSVRGGIKIGYSASGANIPLQLSSEKAYVALTKSAVTSALGYTPPTTDTTYSVATASKAGLVKPVSVITKPTLNSVTTTSGKYYQVQMSSDGNMFVNVPWQAGSSVDLSSYATLASPTFTGTPQAPTATLSTSNTQIATTKFVHDVVNDTKQDFSQGLFDLSAYNFAGQKDNPNLTYYATDNGTTTAGAWLGKNDNVTSLFDGLSVKYKIKVAGSSATTFNLNGLGAKPVYLRGTTRLTTHYAVDTMLHLIYSSSKGAWYVADYDSNSDSKLYQYYTLTQADGEYPIIYSYTTETGTSSYKSTYGAVKAGFTFNPYNNALSVGNINLTDSYLGIGALTISKGDDWADISINGQESGISMGFNENGDAYVDLYGTVTVNGEPIGSGGGGNTKTPYATSSTASGTAAKVATISSNDDNFSLAVGQRVAVKFTYASTVANPTLNVNNTGAKAIYGWDYTAITATEGWGAGDICEFMYNGTYWIWINDMPYAAKSTSSSTTAGTKGAVRIRVYNGNLYIHTS